VGVRPDELSFPEKFRVLFTETARYFAFYGGRGGSKSWSVATWLVLEACRRRVRIVCCRQYQSSIDASSKALLEARIRELGLEGEFHITHRMISHLGTGSVFLFVGLQTNPDSIRSLEGADIFWLEEASAVSQRAWDILLPTARAPGSMLIATWNPGQPDDPVDYFFRGPNPPENACIVEVGPDDNPWFTPDSPLYFERAKLERDDPVKAAHVYGGGYDISYDAKVFLDIRQGRPDDAEMGEAEGPFYGFDPGYTDPCALVEIWIIKRAHPLRDILYIARAIYRYNVPTRDYPAMLDEILHKREAFLAVDNAEPKTIEGLRYVGFNAHGVHKSDETVRDGVSRIKSHAVVINPNCPNAWDEFRGARWPTDRITGKVTGYQIATEHHLIDATRYATLGVNALESLEGVSAIDRILRNRGGVFRVPLFRPRDYGNPFLH
jgi:phage terminase large subunit